MYRILTVVITLARMALKLDNNNFQSVDRAARTAAGITSSRLGSIQASKRHESMSRFGADWSEWTDSEAGFELAGSHLIAIRGTFGKSKFHGPLRMNLGDDQLTIFDFSMYLGERQSTLAPLLQTVGSYRISDLNAPQLYVRPLVNHSSVQTDFLSCFDTVDSMPAHSYNQIVESVLPGPAVRLLDTKTAFTQLLPFVQERQISFEWTGQTLLAYRLQRTVEPDELKAFAQEIVQIAEYLKAAYQDTLTAFDERLVTN